MRLIGAIGGYAIYAPIRRAIGRRAGVLIGGIVAVWFSVSSVWRAAAVRVRYDGLTGLTATIIKARPLNLDRSTLKPGCLKHISEA
jgi:hypothetical protein